MKKVRIMTPVKCEVFGDKNTKKTEFDGIMEGTEELGRFTLFFNHKDDWQVGQTIEVHDIEPQIDNQTGMQREWNGKKDWKLKLSTGGGGRGGFRGSPKTEVTHEQYMVIQDREWDAQSEMVWNKLMTGPMAPELSSVPAETRFKVWAELTSTKTTGAMMARDLVIKPKAGS